MLMSQTMELAMPGRLSAMRKRFPLRLKAYIAYGMTIVFALGLILFVFHQKNILLEKYDELQLAHETENVLHEVEMRIITLIENQNLNIQSIDLEQGPEHISSHLILFLQVYQNTILPALIEIPEAQSLKVAINSAIRNPDMPALRSLSEHLYTLRDILAGRLMESRLYREKLVSDFRKRSDTVAMAALTSGLLVLGILGATVGRFFNHLTEDLLLLKQRSKDIVQGKRGRPIPIRRNDEVAELAESINRMAADLDEHERNLEIERQKSFHQEKMAAIGMLAAGIAHEVGNPIAAISALMEDLLSERMEGGRPSPGPAETSKMQLVLEQTRRLSQITRDISGLVHPQSKEPQLFDLNALIRSTCKLMRYDRRWKDIDFSLVLDKNLPAIEGISDHITQVLMNLLVNALDALEHVRDGQGRLTISTGMNHNQACFTVEDNGSGMSEETVERALQAFYTTKQAGKGSGLGLTLCNSIVEAHGGALKIESERGMGTRIHVFLPLRETPLTAQESVS